VGVGVVCPVAMRALSRGCVRPARGTPRHQVAVESTGARGEVRANGVGYMVIQEAKRAGTSKNRSVIQKCRTESGRWCNKK